MKKTIFKIIILAVLLEVLMRVSVYASSSFRLKFEDGKQVDAGDVVEIPVIIDQVLMDGVQKGVLAFKGTVDYDSDVLDLVAFDSGEYFQIDEDIRRYASASYEEGSKLLFYNLNTNYINDIKDSLNEYTVLGKMKFRANEDAETGNYEITIKDIQVTNDEVSTEGYSETTLLHINGAEQENPVIPDDDDLDSGAKRIVNERDEKDQKLAIEVNEDGTLMLITVDQVNGAKVAYIVVDGKKLDKKDNKFAMVTEPNKTYLLYLYDENGNYIGKEYVNTFIEDKSSDENDEKEKEQKNENQKRPKTGDMIMLSVATLIIFGYSGLALYLVKKKNA